MQIAGREVPLETAVARATTYAQKYSKTLEVFDGLGDNGYVDEDPNRVTLGDIGRLVIINARLSANDVPGTNPPNRYCVALRRSNFVAVPERPTKPYGELLRRCGGSA